MQVYQICIPVDASLSDMAAGWHGKWLDATVTDMTDGRVQM